MYVTRVLFTVTPLQDLILPPFTSKVTRTAFTVLMGEPPALGRMASFSVLFREGKPLYKRPGQHVLTASAGENLEAQFSIISRENPRIPESAAEFTFGNALLHARVEEVEIVRLEELSTPLPRKFVVHYLTPTLLPIPGRSPFLREAGIRRRYKLLPDLALAMRLLTYDLKMRKIDLVPFTPFQVYKWTMRAVAELDYKVRPETVIYTVRDGKPSIERGFTGYVAYELLDAGSEMAKAFTKLIALAQYMGLGKSRSIGFGHIQVSPLAERPNPKKDLQQSPPG